jgi:DNA-directed RNA polymerase subunit RPC12/RpoP
MVGRPQGVDHRRHRDEVTLAEVHQFQLNMVLECQGCGHKRLMDAGALLAKWPPQTTMKQIAARARCKNRGCKGRSGAEVLFCLGLRKDDWWPRAPIVRR